MEEKPGFGFRPNDYELVVYYLLHKIQGNDSLVDGVIREINNICSLDPWDLLFQSKIKSRDLFWYFLSRRDDNGGKQNRKTTSGHWKLTGLHVDVKDQWGHLTSSRGEKIGQKRVLTFHSGNPESSSISSEKKRSAWVMHELHYTHTDLPEHKRTSYVICRLEYKGEDVSILSADHTFAPTMANSASSMVDQGNSGGYYNTFPDCQDQQFSGISDTLQSFQEYFDINFKSILDSEYALQNQSDWYSDHLNLEPPPAQVPYSAQLQYLEEKLMRDDFSQYRPKKPVTGYFSGYSSDSDTDSMIGRDAWSSTDSVGSKDGPYHTPKDDTPSLSTVEPLNNYEAQEQTKQLELQVQGLEKVINKQKSECERKMAEDSIKKAPSTTAVKQSWIVLEEMSQRNSRWIHLKNRSLASYCSSPSLVGSFLSVR
ncbi:hypothetical protein Bca4012_056633 [Brassica carinata]